MSEYTSKAALLAEVDSSHRQFNALIASLNEQQLTTPGVNDGWSAKDNIAHVSAWQKVLLARLLAAGSITHYEDATEGIEVDVINEQFYQQNKDRSLSDVLAEFDSVYQQVVQTLEHLTDAQLNKPQDWLAGQPVVRFVAGDTIEHYQEHSQIIQAWLDGESRV